jgi:hypothetical protein
VTLFLVLAGAPGMEKPVLVTTSVELAQAQLDACQLTHPHVYIQPAMDGEPIDVADAVYPVGGVA